MISREKYWHRVYLAFGLLMLVFAVLVRQPHPDDQHAHVMMWLIQMTGLFGMMVAVTLMAKADRTRGTSRFKKM